MTGNIRKTLGCWYLFVASIAGGRDKESGPSSAAIFALSFWFTFILMTWFGTFSKYVFNLWGGYSSLWPPVTNFRDPSNPNAHIALLMFGVGLVLAFAGYKYLVDNGVNIPNCRPSFKRFLLFMALCFWPVLVLFVSFQFGGFALQCVVHLLTVAYFYRKRNTIEKK